MQRRPRTQGPTYVNEEPTSIVTFSTAEIALIGGFQNSQNLYPYAETAVVPVDNQNILVRNIADANIPAGQNLAFGAFVFPDLTKIAKGDGLYLQVCMSILVRASTASVVSIMDLLPIIGRPVSGTIVSSKAAQSNQLAYYQPLGGQFGNGAGQNATSTFQLLVHTFAGDVYQRLDLGEGGGDIGTPFFVGYKIMNQGGSAMVMQQLESWIDVSCSDKPDRSYDAQLS